MPLLQDIIPTQKVDHSNVKLGQVKAKERPRLKLEQFVDIEKALTYKPKECHRSYRKAFNGLMFANGPDPTVTSNKYLAEYGCGDCVDATIGKSIIHLKLGAKTAPAPVVADNCVQAYSEDEGFDPSQTDQDGNNPTDNGSDPVKAFNKWKRPGFPLNDGTRDQIAGYVEVDVNNTDHVEFAIYQFDVIAASINLPLTAQNEMHWIVVNPDLTGEAEPGSWGGHEIPLVSYDKKCFAFPNWGTTYLLDYPFLRAYCDLLLVPLSKDILNYKGISQTGVDWTLLNQALASL